MIEATQPTEQARPRRARRKYLRNCLAGLLVIGLLLPILMGWAYIADAMFDAPWAYSLLGRPTLTGAWQGAFQTASGLKFAIRLDLRHDVLTNGRPYIQNYAGGLITGEASWCDSKGRCALNIPLHGAVPILTGYNGSADRVELDLDSASRPQKGLLPDIFTGTWQGNSLVLKPTFSFWTGSTYDYSRNNPDLSTPISVTLRKVNETAYRNAWTFRADFPLQLLDVGVTPPNWGAGQE